ncbi:MAG: glycosyl transferase family 2 [Salinivirgaceae bacterium]|nr:MAG: glycosyl transferase family 2 [Salinivirgaceae bacterium]
MKLSVIIVNYNVLHFLRQCLQSVENATKNISAEIFVVDNNSVDGSVAMVRDEFPNVILIDNKDNVGFSKANNQAIKQARGEYLLLLNPDTVVEEGTFTKVVAFMDEHEDAGGLGVKMIDGNGRFLPESKRGLPTPMVAFYKIAGLSTLFPNSKRFGKYHLKYLDKEKVHEVDVLSGAFMLLRKSIIDKIGGLDETFFMYGEDIDLSYRITQAGYKNYYFPDTTIIHYKGESTKKDSINYVVVFYNAMIIFAKKHFAKKYASFFSFMIKMAIMFSAALAIGKRILHRLFYPVVDFAMVWLGFWVITPIWEKYQFGATGWFPDYYLSLAVPVYALVWIIALVYSGAYDKPFRLQNTFKGVGWGVLLLLIIYALLPEHYRFSRVMLILGAVWSAFVLPLLRVVYNNTRISSSARDSKKYSLVVGDESDIAQLEKILAIEKFNEIIGHVSASESSQSGALGNLNNIDEVVRVNKVSEVIFSALHLSARDIIRLMIRLGKPGIKFKIVSPDGISVIGSSTIHSLDDLYSVEVNTIVKPDNQRFKRTFDFGFAIFTLILFPVIILTVKSKSKLLRNIWQVLIGRKSWVGFAQTSKIHELPAIRKGVLNPSMLQKDKNLNEDMLQRLNMIYAKDYRVINDLAIVFRLWKQLGH